MQATAITTLPFSNSQACDSFRPSDCTAFGADLGRETFVDFLEPHTARDRFIGEHGSECAPASVQDGFCHLGFCQAGSIHVADEDCRVLTNEAGTEFVQVVFPAVLDLGVDRLDAQFLVGALRNSELRFKSTIELLCLDLLAVAERGEVLQTKVDADGAGAFGCMRLIDFAVKVDKPMSLRILGEASSLDLAVDGTREPEAEGMTTVGHGIISDLDAGCFERYPTERLLATPAQATFLDLLATNGVFLTYRLNALGVQTEFFAAAGRQLVEIEASRPALIPPNRTKLRFVGKVPHERNGARNLAERISAT